MFSFVRKLDGAATRWATLAGVLLVVACAASKSENPEVSGSTHWLTCESPADCEPYPDATCSEGYCVDEEGIRIAVSAAETGGPEATDAERGSDEVNTESTEEMLSSPEEADTDEATDGSPTDADETSAAEGVDAGTTGSESDPESMSLPPEDATDEDATDAADESAGDAGVVEPPPATAECPAGPPAGGAACSSEGQRCEYAGSPTASTFTCTGGNWLEEGSNGEDPCPESLPTSGAMCPEPSSPAISIACLFDCAGTGDCAGNETCGAYQAQCLEQAEGWRWTVLSTTECAVPACPDCELIADPICPPQTTLGPACPMNAPVHGEACGVEYCCEYQQETRFGCSCVDGQWDCETGCTCLDQQ